MRFVRENRQMANRNLYREDVLQMLFADSDSEGEYLPFGNDDRPSNDRASPGTSLQRVQGERVHEAQTSDHLTLCPTGMGVAGVAGVDVVVVSIGELLISELTERRWLRAAVLMIGQTASFFLIARALRAASTGAVSVGLVYHTLKNYKLSLRYLNGQIAGQLITK